VASAEVAVGSGEDEVVQGSGELVVTLMEDVLEDELAALLLLFEETLELVLVAEEPDEVVVAVLDIVMEGPASGEFEQGCWASEPHDLPESPGV